MRPGFSVFIEESENRSIKELRSKSRKCARCFGSDYMMFVLKQSPYMNRLSLASVEKVVSSIG